jgi:hypothetical protein
MNRFRRDIVLRGIRVSLVVGTVLALINHGDTMLTGGLTLAAIYKVLLTYFVPFAVSVYSGVRASGDDIP